MLVVAWVVFFWSISKRFRLMALGKPAMQWDNIVDRTVGTLKFAVGQARMPRYPFEGWLHIIIFFGFLVLLLRSIILWGRGAYDPEFNLAFLFGPIHEMNLLGQLYTLAKDLVALAVLTAAAIALYNRVVNKPARLTQSSEANLILVIIITMMFGDILYDAAEILLYHAVHPEHAGFAWYEPVGHVASMILAPIMAAFGAEITMPASTGLLVVSGIGFWVHSALVLIFLNLLPYGKHFHVVTAIPNVFLRDVHSPGRLPPIENLEAAMEEMEDDDRFGVGQVTDFTWKGLLDLYSCTECGRCTDNCPANQTGKKLSPKHLTIHLRNNLYGRQGELLGEEPEEVVGAKADEPPVEGPIHFGHGKDAVPAVPELFPAVVDPEEVWACTTCRACERECPVFISYVDKMVSLRQHLVLDQGDVPQELANALRGLETNSNPWNISSMDRAKWASGHDVRTLGDLSEEEARGVEYLLFVGCAGSFDDRAKKVAVAMVRLLNEAGVDYAILGSEEQCTGDIARRAGNEYLFQMMAQANVEVFGKYNVKKIITICPHCFNTLQNEYPDFGGNYEVLTHSGLLLDLVRSGRLKPTQRVDGSAAYHDSCYLGRYNEIYEQPRELLEAIPGLSVVDNPEKCRDRALCCGAGGAQYFKEEEPGDERVNIRRTNQLLDTGCTTIATACPFCMTMLTDGLKAQDKEEEIAQLDLAELLAQSCGLSKKKKADDASV
jgi:Fe-S oxidoreductase